MSRGPRATDPETAVPLTSAEAQIIDQLRAIRYNTTVIANLAIVAALAGLIALIVLLVHMA